MTNQDNGQATEKPVQIIYETQSGVIFHITPINLGTLRAIQLKAESLFPYPDKAPYQQPEENAFADNQMTPAEDNPEYVAAVEAVNRERSQWTDKAVWSIAVRLANYSEAELVAKYSDQLANLRKVATLPEDDFEAVLHHIVLSFNQVGLDNNRQLTSRSSDFSRIIQAAIQTIPLTPAEVTAGIRFFRLDVSRLGN